ncbi:MAG: zinc-dependent peptidase [Flavisolibacter sp.]
MLANILFLCFLATIFIIRYWHLKFRKQRGYTNLCPNPVIDKTDIVFEGSSINITDEQLHFILFKRHRYYRSLQEVQQKRFLKRLRRLLNNKTFIIKDNKGYKEMPVLVSAAAIQLTFGLNEYLLPFYKYIRIYPEEFVGQHTYLTLAGNVQNNIITVAWNQLLHGLNKADGSNVVLHEMSHALYIQKMVIEADYAKTFSNQYLNLESNCATAYNIEIKGIRNLYSDYAETNLQEFWAETVEIFFERPHDLYKEHPDVFDAMTVLLNQDPRKESDPVIKTNLSFNEKFENLKGVFRRKTLK